MLVLGCVYGGCGWHGENSPVRWMFGTFFFVGDAGVLMPDGCAC